MAASELVVIAAAVVLMGAAGALVIPRAVSAAGAARFQERVPADPARAAVHAGLRELISSCRSVVGVVREPASPFTDVVLWGADANGSGEVEPSEVLVLSHSAVTGAVMAHVWGSGGDTDETRGAGAAGGPGVPGLPGVPGVPWVVLGDAEFPGRWRGRADVASRVIATGIRAMRVERAGEGGRFETFRVLLTWEGPVSDEGAMESAFEVRLRRAQDDR